jgi:aspartyl-tRNA(Asn)/glutamyl-tRNA(Gln) amidotransferase subunit A
MRDAAVAACHPFDFVLSPTSPVPAFDAGLASPLNDPERPVEHIAFTVAYNMSEQPAVSVNWDFTGEGLPIGLQVVGARHDDLGVLQLARALEQLRPPQRPWPMADSGA